MLEMSSASKLGKGKSLTRQTKEVILNLIKYHESEIKKNPSLLDSPAKFVSKSTGFSLSTIYRIVKEKRENPEQSLKCPKKKKARKCVHDLDHFDKGVLRRTIHNLHIIEQEFPSLKRIHQKFKEDTGYAGSVSTLRKHVKSIGFEWKRTQCNKKIIMEKHNIRYMRINFLTKIAEYRLQGRPIVFTNESYILTSHFSTLSESDGSNICVKQPVANGNCLIMIHAGGKDGFVPNALLMFKTNAKSSNYHDQMDFDNYETWLKTQLIPNLKPNSVVVVDNASYHNKIQNLVPTSYSRKQEIIDWLTAHDIPYSASMLKPVLYELILQNKSSFLQYRINDILKNHGHTVLRLPPYHPELNPIESIWGMIKGYVGQRNVLMNMQSILSLAKEKIENITVEEWQNVCRHAEQEEEMFKCKEIELDNFSEKCNLSVGVESSSSSESETSDSE